MLGGLTKEILGLIQGSAEHSLALLLPYEATMKSQWSAA